MKIKRGETAGRGFIKLKIIRAAEKFRPRGNSSRSFLPAVPDDTFRGKSRRWRRPSRRLTALRRHPSCCHCIAPIYAEHSGTHQRLASSWSPGIRGYSRWRRRCDWNSPAALSCSSNASSRGPDWIPHGPSRCRIPLASIRRDKKTGPP